MIWLLLCIGFTFVQQAGFDSSDVVIAPHHTSIVLVHLDQIIFGRLAVAVVSVAAKVLSAKGLFHFMSPVS